MATIFKHDGPHTREEQLANTWPKFKQAAPLTPAQLDELRAKSATNNPNSHSARNAKAASERAARQEASRKV
jgi:hypothetical protein